MVDIPSETLRHAVFHTLAYADIFDYPLTAPEVQRYLTSATASLEQVRRALGDESLFTRVGDYFTLRGREGIVVTRARRAEVAARLWPRAARYGRILAALPFVRMLAVTGSLAMSNTDEGTDVDFMIVTAPGRLWTCRALSLLVARLARLEGIALCPNYLVTTQALQLEERSLYAAHELTQMIPLSGLGVYRELRRQNEWTADYLPNAGGAPGLPPWLSRPFDHRPGRRWQAALELVFDRLPTGRFERWEMNRKIARLSREQSSSTESRFTADVCKGHVDRHGQRVVAAFAVRLKKAV